MINKLPSWLIWGAALLAFSAGCVNITALLGFANLSVSHVTGNVSLFSSSIAHLDVHKFLYIGAVLASFLTGAVLSGFIIHHEPLTLGSRYGVALAVEAGLLIAAVIFFYQKLWLGEMLASMACGLQNAMIATYSGSVIRTTHLTGITSDIGEAVGTWLSGRQIDGKTLKLQVLIWLMFLSGGITGALCYRFVGFRTLFLPASIVLLAAVGYNTLSHRLTPKQKLKQSEDAE